MTTTYTFKRQEFRALLQRAADAGALAAAIVCRDTAAELLNGPSPSAPGSSPGKDTGHLASSVAAVGPAQTGIPGKAAFGTNVPYGRHLEFGAFITPKHSKYLAVPVDRMLVSKLQGIKRSFLFSYLQRTRNIPGLRYVPPRKGANNGGRLVLENRIRGINVRGPKKKTRTAQAGTTVFVLKRSVVLKPRPWILRAAWQAAPEARSKFQQVAMDVLKGGGVAR